LLAHSFLPGIQRNGDRNALAPIYRLADETAKGQCAEWPHIDLNQRFVLTLLALTLVLRENQNRARPS